MSRYERQTDLAIRDTCHHVFRQCNVARRDPYRLPTLELAHAAPVGWGAGLVGKRCPRDHQHQQARDPESPLSQGMSRPLLNLVG